MGLLDNRVFLRFARRAEGADRELLIGSFFESGPIISVLSTDDHQIIYGRRGTGKTHALMYLQHQLSSHGDVAVYLDLRNMGSSSSIYSDPSIPANERGLRLILDVLREIHDALVDFALSDQNDVSLTALTGHLDELAGAISEVKITGTSEYEVTESEDSSSTDAAKVNIGFSPGGPSASLELTDGEAASSRTVNRVKKTGAESYYLNFGSVHGRLRSVREAIDKKIWVMVDEWSSVPLDIQPFLADLLRRTFMSTQGIVVKIAAIEQRSKFRIAGDNYDYVGIEIGADASADLNLDDFMVFDNDPTKAKAFFQELIFKHYATRLEPAERGDAASTSAALVASAFTQVSAFEELVKAMEGVPRDGINILRLAAQRANEGKISVNDVRNAASTWYTRDKESAVASSADAISLLHWIIDKVIAHRKARAFLIDVSSGHTLIDTLFDSRVIHILKKYISAHDEPGVRYHAYKIDYGCYVNLINTSKEPQGNFLTDLEGGGEQTFTEVPPDDYRAIRRAILDMNTFDRKY